MFTKMKRKAEAAAAGEGDSQQSKFERERKRRVIEKNEEAEISSWINGVFSRGLLWNDITQSEIDNAKTFEERRQLAIQFEIKKEWYWDWNEQQTRRWAADYFLDYWKLTRRQIHQLLLENDAEPWMSINAFNGLGTKVIDPTTRDSRVDYLYDLTYPWAGYLIQFWFPKYGDNWNRFGQRVVDFKFRISHIIPDPVIGTQHIVTEAEKIIKETKKDIVRFADKIEDGAKIVYSDTKAGLSRTADVVPYATVSIVAISAAIALSSLIT